MTNSELNEILDAIGVPDNVLSWTVYAETLREIKTEGNKLKEKADKWDELCGLSSTLESVGELVQWLVDNTEDS